MLLSIKQNSCYLIIGTRCYVCQLLKLEILGEVGN